jgi:large subunit ribosomal protein L17
MLANMASSLILHKRIETTVAKAKALREYVEPLITKSKEDTTHSRRTVFSYLKTKEAVAELFRDVAPKIADRPGGYTRIIKTGFRLGDAADMAMIELVDFNQAALSTSEKREEKRGTRRSRAKKVTEPKAAPKSAPKPEPKSEPDVKSTPPESEHKLEGEPTIDPTEEK